MAARCERSLTLAEVSARSGLKTSTIAGIERGRTPSLSALFKLSAALDATIVIRSKYGSGDTKMIVV